MPHPSLTRLLIAVIAGAGLAFGAPAAQAEDMRAEYQQQYESADRLLNAEYRAVSAKLDAASKRRLVAAELAWIAFRDAEMVAEADRYRGGTTAAMTALLCNVRLTEQRARELRHWRAILEQSDARQAYGLLGWSPDDRARALSEQRGTFAQADQLLNVAYQAYLKTQDATGRRLNTKAQLAWITFRDREVALAAVLVPPSGDAAFARQQTLAALTGERASDLQVYLEELRSR